MSWTGGGECRGEDAVSDVVPAHDGALGHAAVGVAAGHLRQVPGSLAGQSADDIALLRRKMSKDPRPGR
jgi:hypothetical protein